MYLTLKQIANQYDVTDVLGFVDHVLENHPSLVVNNPDISVTEVAECHMINIKRHNPAYILPI